MKKGIFALSVLCALCFSAKSQTVFFHGSFDEAKAQAAKENKMIFIDFFTDWCGPCKMMSNQIFPMEKVGDFMNKNFVNLKLDAEKEGAAKAAEFSVKSYPTFVIVDAEGKLVGKFSGGSDADRFLNRLESKMNPDLAPDRVAEKYNSGDRDPKLVRTYVQQLSENRKNNEAFEILNSYYSSLNETALMDDDNSFVFTMMPPSYGDSRMEFIEKHSQILPDSRQMLIKNAYSREIMKYFEGNKFKDGNFSADSYSILKNKFAQEGLDKDYAAMFDFIDNRLALNNDEFLAYCENKFDSFDDNTKLAFLKAIPTIFNPQTPEEKGKLSSFIRKRLPSMHYNAIAMSAQTLFKLEN